MAKYYAWSDIYNGGKTEDVTSPTGQVKHVVVERNVTPRGSAVTKSKLGVSDADWDRFIENGVIRSYPVPDEADEYVSPTQAVLRRLSQGGELNQDMLLELAMTTPPAENPPADEGAEVPVGA